MEVVEEMISFERVNGGGGGGGRDMRSEVLGCSVVWKAAASDHRQPTVAGLNSTGDVMELIVQREARPFGEGKTAPQEGIRRAVAAVGLIATRTLFAGVSEPAKMSGIFHAIGCALASLRQKDDPGFAPRIWEPFPGCLYP